MVGIVYYKYYDLYCLFCIFTIKDLFNLICSNFFWIDNHNDFFLLNLKILIFKLDFESYRSPSFINFILNDVPYSSNFFSYSQSIINIDGVNKYESFIVLQNEFNKKQDIPYNLAIKYGKRYMDEFIFERINQGRQVYYRAVDQDISFSVPLSGTTLKPDMGLFFESKLSDFKYSAWDFNRDNKKELYNDYYLKWTDILIGDLQHLSRKTIQSFYSLGPEIKYALYSSNAQLIGLEKAFPTVEGYINWKDSADVVSNIKNATNTKEMSSVIYNKDVFFDKNTLISTVFNPRIQNNISYNLFFDDKFLFNEKSKFDNNTPFSIFDFLMSSPASSNDTQSLFKDSVNEIGSVYKYNDNKNSENYFNSYRKSFIISNNFFIDFLVWLLRNPLLDFNYINPVSDHYSTIHKYWDHRPDTTGWFGSDIFGFGDIESNYMFKPGNTFQRNNDLNFKSYLGYTNNSYKIAKPYNLKTLEYFNSIIFNNSYNNNLINSINIENYFSDFKYLFFNSNGLRNKDLKKNSRIRFSNSKDIALFFKTFKNYKMSSNLFVKKMSPNELFYTFKTSNIFNIYYILPKYRFNLYYDIDLNNNFNDIDIRSIHKQFFLQLSEKIISEKSFSLFAVIFHNLFTDCVETKNFQPVNKNSLITILKTLDLISPYEVSLSVIPINVYTLIIIKCMVLYYSNMSYIDFINLCLNAINDTKLLDSIVKIPNCENSNTSNINFKDYFENHNVSVIPSMPFIQNKVITKNLDFNLPLISINWLKSVKIKLIFYYLFSDIYIIFKSLLCNVIIILFSLKNFLMQILQNFLIDEPPHFYTQKSKILAIKSNIGIFFNNIDNSYHRVFIPFSEMVSSDLSNFFTNNSSVYDTSSSIKEVVDVTPVFFNSTPLSVIYGEEPEFGIFGRVYDAFEILQKMVEEPLETLDSDSDEKMDSPLESIFLPSLSELSDEFWDEFEELQRIAISSSILYSWFDFKGKNDGFIFENRYLNIPLWILSSFVDWFFNFYKFTFEWNSAIYNFYFYPLINKLNFFLFKYFNSVNIDEIDKVREYIGLPKKNDFLFLSDNKINFEQIDLYNKKLLLSTKFLISPKDSPILGYEFPTIKNSNNNYISLNSNHSNIVSQFFINDEKKKKLINFNNSNQLRYFKKKNYEALKDMGSYLNQDQSTWFKKDEVLSKFLNLKINAEHVFKSNYQSKEHALSNNHPEYDSFISSNNLTKSKPFYSPLDYSNFEVIKKKKQFAGKGFINLWNTNIGLDGQNPSHWSRTKMTKRWLFNNVIKRNLLYDDRNFHRNDELDWYSENEKPFDYYFWNFTKKNNFNLVDKKIYVNNKDFI